MADIAKRKLHFAPLVRQQREIDRLLRARRYQNVSEFMRAAIDHYLDSIGRPTLSQQAREMADELSGRNQRDADRVQEPSMETEERW